MTKNFTRFFTLMDLPAGSSSNYLSLVLIGILAFGNPVSLGSTHPNSGQFENSGTSLPSRTQMVLSRLHSEKELKSWFNRPPVKALLAPGPLIPGAEGNNLLLNPGFEDGMDDWNVSGYAAVTDNRYVQEGNYYGYLWYDGGSTTIYQEIDNIIPGETYDLTWYGGTHDDFYNHRVGMSFYDSGGSQIGSTTWVQVDYVVGCCSFGVDYPMAYYDLDGTDDNDLNEEGISLVAPASAFTVRVTAVSSGGDYLKLDGMCLDGLVCENPTASDDSYEICDDETLSENVGDNDSDLGSTTFTITSGPSNGTASIDDSGNLDYTPVASFVGTDNLTYEVCNDGACCASASVSIKVEATPVVSVATADPICGQDNGSITFSFGNTNGRSNIEFSMDGGSSYPLNVKDNIGSASFTDLVAGTYDLWVRWGNDECPVDLGSETLTEVPGPTADAGENQSICIGETAELIASGGDTYLWSTGETGTSIEVTPDVTTTYSVTVTDANNCTDTDEVEVTVNALPTLVCESNVNNEGWVTEDDCAVGVCAGIKSYSV